MSRLVRAAAGRLFTFGALFTAHRATQNALQTPAKRLLVVCYGNIYRSAYLGAYLKQHSQGRIEVRSTGFHHKTGRPAPDRHIAMSRDAGVDLTQHRSSRIDPQDLEWADIVVIMDRHNWHALWRMGVQMKTLRKKVVWAGALSTGTVEIRDPYEMTDQAAKNTIDRLRAAGEHLLAKFAAR